MLINMSWLPTEDTDKVITPEALTHWRNHPTSISTQEHENHCFEGFIYIHPDGAMTECPICHNNSTTTGITRTLQKAGIPERYLNIEWNDLQMLPPLPRLEIASKRINDLMNNGANALLHGEPGTGKTTAAILIMKAAIRSNLTARIENINRVSIMIQDKLINETTIINQLASTDVLTLDNVTTSDLRHVGLRLLNTVLEDRQNNARPTILTTNLKPEILTTDIGTNLITRLEPLSIIHFNHGKNFRKANADTEELW